MNSKRTRPTAAQLGYLCSWLTFVAVLGVLEGWSSAPPLYLFIGFLALTGTLCAVLWIAQSPKWVHGALGCSTALVSAYVLWWAIDIGRRYTAGLGLGLLESALLQVEIWVGMARSLIGRSHYLYAFSQLYWGLLMALVQLAFLPTLVRSLKAMRSSVLAQRSAA